MLRYRTTNTEGFFADVAYALGEASVSDQIPLSKRSGDLRGASFAWRTKTASIGYGREGKFAD